MTITTIYLRELGKELCFGPAGVRRWWQRSGFGLPASSGRTLFYCHGVGEIKTLLPLLPRLTNSDIGAELPLLLTYGRDAWAFARRHHRERFGRIIYIPYDDARAIQRSFSALDGGALVVVESDLAPRYLHGAKAHGMKVAALNVSTGHWRDQKLHGLTETYFARLIAELDLVTFKEPSLRGRFARHQPSLATAHAENLRLAASTKPTRLTDEALDRQLTEARDESFILVAGSTYQEEERLLFAACGALLRSGRLRLIVAPRKVARAPTLALQATAAGFSCARRSTLAAGAPLPEVTVIDRMGELTALYSYADAAFVGGTIRNKGGHNLFEPAAAGIPILFGPHYHNNFAFALDLLESGGGERIVTAEQLRACVERWLDAPEKRLASGAAARAGLGRGEAILSATASALHSVLATGEQP